MSEKLTDKIQTVLQNLQELEKQFNEKLQILTESLKIIKPYVSTIKDQYEINNYYSEIYKEGKYPPYENFKIKQRDYKCNEDQKHPHLYHTFDPQLNNITDMIQYLIDNCCNKKETKTKDKEILNKIKELLKELELKQDFPQKKQTICIELDKLKDLISSQKICLTYEDILTFIKGKTPQIKQNETISWWHKPPF